MLLKIVKVLVVQFRVVFLILHWMGCDCQYALVAGKLYQLKDDCRVVNVVISYLSRECFLEVISYLPCVVICI